ncbi:hypothetical protein RhiirC2_778317 [Rhizophagus irregularis]|uniref:Uncharacterized protein n=1 Tax=Rhizophagus irregularis TaxID=588596 RepID=A0A2N1NC82_9GLOM|nr:hypothetical protein RhiirC2_778317 [Rhizophagus irregularis]
MSNFAKRRRKAAKLKQHEELNEQIANFSPLHIENPVEDYGWSDCYPASVTSEDTKQLETRPKKRDSLDTLKRFPTSENSRSEGVDVAFGEGEVKKEVNGLYPEDLFRIKLYLDNVNSKKPLSGYPLLTGYPSIQSDLLYPDTNTKLDMTSTIIIWDPILILLNIKVLNAAAFILLQVF